MPKKEEWQRLGALSERVVGSSGGATVSFLLRSTYHKGNYKTLGRISLS